MFLVCALHSDEFGLWTNIGANPASQAIHSIWHNFSYMGVNLFMLITGYCCIHSQWRLSRYILLYLQVVFYSTGYIILMLLLPFQSTDLVWQTVIQHCIDIPFAGGYWYFTTYTGLFFLIPFLNKLLLSLNDTQFKSLATTSILVFSILNTGSHAYIAQHGQNLIWMITCYILGAYIRTTNIPGSPSTWFTLFLVSLSACTAINHLIPVLNRDYTALVFVFSCISIFISLSKLQIRSSRISSILAWAAPLSFGVYLFHTHPLMWAFVARIALRIAYSLDFSWYCWIIIPCSIYLTGTGVNWIRAYLFRKADIHQFAEKTSGILTRMARKLL